MSIKKTLFESLLESPVRYEPEPVLPVGFEPHYMTCSDGIIRSAGWEKVIFTEIDGRKFRLMDLRINRDMNTLDQFKGTVDFERMFQEIGSGLSDPQDILGVFPLDWIEHGDGQRIESDWKDNVHEAFDDIADEAAEVVGRIMSAIDKRHERRMAVYDIYKATRGCSVTTLSIGKPTSEVIPPKVIPPKVEKLAEGVKGDNFEDAVKRWMIRCKGPRPVIHGGYFPSEEEARVWLEQQEEQRKCGFIVKEEKEEKQE